ncbi:ABC transporter ATP-binding protein [Candidatus Magnetobacterium casense]|uniref:ABC transporter ATP-binding protein n=1 Tax=Candidatus Magnetobacterium casense TaxID=1455061 RepID=A0ABS6RWV9_9BACT|nr:ABC transporter ATP-binding protein [Candidatus Magnetobacterium casensis]MBV6341112.1 ABC transporter ATP-binding protein [Candidatus Magnetobacterium casensis]
MKAKTNELIRITNLRKSYVTEAGEIPVLRGLTMSVERGEVISIMGSSGVGKSTFLHCLGTLDRPTSGEVLYEDMDVFKLNNSALASFRNKTIGFVFQFHHLLSEFSALKNVMMPGLIAGLDRDEVKDRATVLLKELGLGHRLRHTPGELSGGEQQRVAMARALITEPLVVLADEPTGNLDTKTGEALIDLIHEINTKKSTTFVIVTHNMLFAHKSNKIYYMVDGTIADTEIRR